MEVLEIVRLGIDTLEEWEGLHASVTHFAVLNRVVVAYHVDVEEVFNLLEREGGMLHEIGRAAKVGVLARDGQEVDVELGAVLGVVSRTISILRNS